jgi:hypothetical protein
MNLLLVISPFGDSSLVSDFDPPEADRISDFLLNIRAICVIRGSFPSIR